MADVGLVVAGYLTADKKATLNFVDSIFEEELGCGRVSWDCG
jgi:hypothetical protein